MLTGNSIPKDQPTRADQYLPTWPGWRPIVNADIKLANVVLGHANRAFYPAYKTPQMIDFGLAFDNNLLANRASKQFNGQFVPYGTEGFRPPVRSTYLYITNITNQHLQEQFCPPVRRYENEPVNSRADVWNVGILIFNLMEAPEIRAWTQPMQRPKHSHGYDRVYSHALEELVAECMAPNPNDRPSVRKLLYATRVGLQRWEKVHGAVSGADVPERYGIPWTEEEFKIGMRYGRPGTKRRKIAEDPKADDPIVTMTAPNARRNRWDI